MVSYTPLHEAVSNGHTQILQLLLRHDGDVNSRANNGCTLLHLAASSGHVNCVRVLLDKGADMANKDGYGRTPIQIAELNSRHGGVIKVLKSAGECISTQVLYCPHLHYCLGIKNNEY